MNTRTNTSRALAPTLAPSRLRCALLAALLLPLSSFAFAQTESTSEETNEVSAQLDRVTVTGSLIPQSQIETFVPVSTITSEDIKARGFTSVVDVLQAASFATGGVQGNQNSASFTQGAETVSLFGLPPGYVKYLIDGRPMANYPALYNGSETFNNISGIPVELIDRVEILPGGQSSLYGSDAIAGVINFILKKEIDGATVTVRAGGYSDKGGDSFRASIADGFSAMDGRLNALMGVQYEEREPIWSADRAMTAAYNGNALDRFGNPIETLASRDFLIYSPFSSYNFLDPNNCANVSGLFGGTTGIQERPGFGDGNYCGSFATPGYRTLMNDKVATQLYGHMTFDLSDNARLYLDTLYSEEEISYHVGSGYTWWGTDNWGYFYDPNLDDFLGLQRAFAPEEMGAKGFADAMDFNKSKAFNITIGVDGYLGESNWEYDVGYTRTEYELDEKAFVRWADPIEQYFINNVLGPQQGLDPIYGMYPVFTPDYAAFYQTMSQEDFRSITGYAVSKSKTSEDTLRAQFTNPMLFEMPAGDVGVAVVAEAGRQKWGYMPHEGFMNGDIWGSSAVSGLGERDRYSLTSEFRLPLMEQLTMSMSGRYDAFKPEGGSTIDKPTYSLGLEYRPLETLLVRGKYGSAFRAPTLSDLYQGESGSYTSVIDYSQCAAAGFDPNDSAQIRNCPTDLSNRQVVSTSSGSLDLDAIDADVWSVGFVYSPISRMTITMDYHNWDISDEVTRQSADGLLMQEYRCNAGLEDMNSAMCQATMAFITRDGMGDISRIHTPKINVSNQQLEAMTASVNYGFSAGGVGDFNARLSYTQKIRHQIQEYAGDAYIDQLNSPYYNTDPKRKGDVSLSWSKGLWSSTVYANWIEKTPNYRARLINRINDPWLDINAAGNTDALIAQTDPRVVAGMLGSYTTYNWSLSLNPIEPLTVSLLVNNVFDKMPSVDHSQPASSSEPYNTYNYNVYGRAFFLEARYNFGTK